MIVILVSVDSDAMCSVLPDLTLPAQTVSATAALKAGVGNTVKRKGVLDCSTQTVPAVALATALLRFATVIQVGLDGDAKNLPVLVPQCAAPMANVRPLGTPRSVLVIRGGWAELARLNVSMVLPGRQVMVLTSASVMVATVV